MMIPIYSSAMGKDVLLYLGCYFGLLPEEVGKCLLNVHDERDREYTLDDVGDVIAAKTEADNLKLVEERFKEIKALENRVFLITLLSRVSPVDLSAICAHVGHCIDSAFVEEYMRRWKHYYLVDFWRKRWSTPLEQYDVAAKMIRDDVTYVKIESENTDLEHMSMIYIKDMAGEEIRLRIPYLSSSGSITSIGVVADKRLADPSLDIEKDIYTITVSESDKEYTGSFGSIKGLEEAGLAVFWRDRSIKDIYNDIHFFAKFLLHVMENSRTVLDMELTREYVKSLLVEEATEDIEIDPEFERSLDIFYPAGIEERRSFLRKRADPKFEEALRAFEKAQ